MGGGVANILICEDDEFYRQIAEVAFASPGHEITFLENGFSVASRLSAGTFDLLITDIVMPGKDGLEVIRELRNSGLAIPILVMSGGVSTLKAPILAAASALGADEIIAKPFRPQMLRERAEALMKKCETTTLNRTA